MVLRCARRRRRIKALECRIRPPIVARQSTDTSSQAQKHRRRDPRSTSREILTRRTRAVNWVLSVAGTQLPTHLSARRQYIRHKNLYRRTKSVVQRKWPSHSSS
ncbi:unnamed protein product [Callosobruchus maculatus]|uniref:Uncharacterized protein n=1 Tax=Callosobruchus maculatus TaxID=64391 RepID=A0A653CZK5_CALMS|nr:unnamed protein product [Callosobruchus maculatus]